MKVAGRDLRFSPSYVNDFLECELAVVRGERSATS
jgi:hypothetical protein